MQRLFYVNLHANKLYLHHVSQQSIDRLHKHSKSGYASIGSESCVRRHKVQFCNKRAHNYYLWHKFHDTIEVTLHQDQTDQLLYRLE